MNSHDKHVRGLLLKLGISGGNPSLEDLIAMLAHAHNEIAHLESENRAQKEIIQHLSLVTNLCLPIINVLRERGIRLRGTHSHALSELLLMLESGEITVKYHDEESVTLLD